VLEILVGDKKWGIVVGYFVFLKEKQSIKFFWLQSYK